MTQGMLKYRPLPILPWPRVRPCHTTGISSLTVDHTLHPPSAAQIRHQFVA